MLIQQPPPKLRAEKPHKNKKLLEERKTIQSTVYILTWQNPSVAVLPRASFRLFKVIHVEQKFKKTKIFQNPEMYHNKKIRTQVKGEIIA